MAAPMATNTSSEIAGLEGRALWLCERASERAGARLWKLLHHDERQPTQLEIADELIFSQGAAPVSASHVGLTENVEQISQLILV